MDINHDKKNDDAFSSEVNESGNNVSTMEVETGGACEYSGKVTNVLCRTVERLYPLDKRTNFSFM